MTPDIRGYLALAAELAHNVDEPKAGELDAIVASATCALALIKREPDGAAALERVMGLVRSRTAAGGAA